MTAASLTPPSNGAPRPVRPRPLASSLVAAASRVTGGKSISAPGRRHSASDGWQGDAWDTYDQVGEQRFLASTLANRMSQARFFVGELADDPSDDPTPIVEGIPFEVFQSLQTTPAALAQMVRRWGVLLFIPGEGYLAGVPVQDTVADQSTPDWLSPLGGQDESGMSLSDLEWHALSEDEVSVSDDDKVTLTISGETRELGSEECWLVRIHRPHPRRWSEPDSPTRSSLPVLRELIGLTMHISAQVDSRLAGAGIFLVPQEAAQEIRQANGMDDSADVAEDISEMLMEAMLTPIADRSNASAIVPLVLEVPGETIEQFRHLSFSTPLDDQIQSLRGEAVRRLALGQDCPPELLLGVSGMNHWGAWLVREDVVTTHIEPPLALICDALTTQFLWPVLEQQGMDEEQVRKYVIWYSVEHLIVRPNRGQDAMNLYDRGELSGSSLREVTGFGDSDAPAIEEDTEAMDPAVSLALDMVRAAPSLAQDPGLPALVQAIRAVLSGEDATNEAVAQGQEPVKSPGTDEGSGSGDDPSATEGDIPATADDPAGIDDELTAGATLPPTLKVTGFLGDAIRRSNGDNDGHHPAAESD